jgi:hypothetical protein
MRLALPVMLLLSAPALAQDRPLSAIGWLDEALTIPLPPVDAPLPDFQPDTYTPEEISVTPLGGPDIDSLGLFNPVRIGLTRDLWANSPAERVKAGLSAMPTDTLPTALQLGYRLLLAEFAAPVFSDPLDPGSVLTTRIDTLIAMGALEQASILLEASPVQTAALNARAFDIALLLGEEDAACARMTGQMSTQYGYGAQIFCLARRGEWQSAFATLNTSRALGLLDAPEAALLERFLEEEEQEVTLPPPAMISPLAWRLLEALGEPVPTASLPVAFAYADLRGTSGWRAQLDAAERLTRAGVMQPNRLLGVYGQRRPAASGGVWDRVQAVQSLDQALQTGDAAVIDAALQRAWPLFVAVELDVAFAQMFAERFDSHQPGPEARDIVWTLLMLAQEHLDRAQTLAPEDERGALVMALAGDAPLPDQMRDTMAQAIVQAFGDQSDLGEGLQQALSTGQPGLALLDALPLLALGAKGDPHSARQGLEVLRAVGLEQAARQIAIELLLIERRG